MKFKNVLIFFSLSFCYIPLHAHNFCEEAFYNLEDVTREIRDIGSEITYDEDRLAEINERIYSISLYKKKYGKANINFYF